MLFCIHTLFIGVILKEVTEQDFRLPQFRGKDPKDYEFNAHNIPVRKDRWKTGILEAAFLVGVSTRAFEISDVIDAIKEQVGVGWETFSEYVPEQNSMVWLKLTCGSVLRDAICGVGGFTWQGFQIPNSGVVEWRAATKLPVRE